MPPVRTLDFLLDERESIESTDIYFMPITVLGSGYIAVKHRTIPALMGLPVKWNTMEVCPFLLLVKRIAL